MLSSMREETKYIDLMVWYDEQAYSWTFVPDYPLVGLSDEESRDLLINDAIDKVRRAILRAHKLDIETDKPYEPRRQLFRTDHTPADPYRYYSP